MKLKHLLLITYGILSALLFCVWPKFGSAFFPIVLLAIFSLGFLVLLFGFLTLKRNLKFSDKRILCTAFLKLRAKSLQYLLFCIMGLLVGIFFYALPDHANVNSRFRNKVFYHALGLVLILIYTVGGFCFLKLFFSKKKKRKDKLC
jgi:hypothetical protein